MAKDEYVYSTSQLAGYYGLTRKGLAYYEEKGLIVPARGENQKYRVYSLSDCYNLYHTKLYENCGYTLSETARSLREDPTEAVAANLQGHIVRMRRRLAVQHRMLERAEHIASTLRRSLDGPVFEIVQSPAFYRLFVRTYQEEHTSDPEETAEFARWNEFIPIDVASLRYDRERILRGDEQLNVNIGNIMLAEDFQELGCDLSARVEYIPSRRCLYTVLAGDAERINHRGWLRDACDCLRSRGLRLCGDPVTALLAVTCDGGTRIRLDEAWFPIGE